MTAPGSIFDLSAEEFQAWIEGDDPIELLGPAAAPLPAAEQVPLPAEEVDLLDLDPVPTDPPAPEPQVLPKAAPAHLQAQLAEPTDPAFVEIGVQTQLTVTDLIFGDTSTPTLQENAVAILGTLAGRNELIEAVLNLTGPTRVKLGTALARAQEIIDRGAVIGQRETAGHQPTVPVKAMPRLPGRSRAPSPLGPATRQHLPGHGRVDRG